MRSPAARSRRNSRMKVAGQAMRTIWVEPDGAGIGIIDQTQLPFALVKRRLITLEEAAQAIRAMLVRGAPLIGVTAAYGMALAMRADPTDAAIDRAIAGHGLPLIEHACEKKGKKPAVDILTHCNAGWLAAVDWGTALAPIYLAHDRGIPLHVWVDETRPRNQGASLTAWELGQHGVRHTVIADNAGGHLMQKGRVDLCLVGTDRTTASGDVANKIGTYLKALAAHDNGVPFYVALPSPTIDWSLADGAGIPIEERDASEVAELAGRLPSGEVARVRIIPEGSAAANYAFDVTPAKYVTGLVTERGVCAASRAGLLSLFPERR